MTAKSEEQKINVRLRNERLRRNLSQQDLAEQLGTSVVSIKRWERNITTPSPYFRLKLTTLFEKTAEELGLLDIETQEEQKIRTVPEQSYPVAELTEPVKNEMAVNKEEQEGLAHDFQRATAQDNDEPQGAHFEPVTQRKRYWDRRKLLKYLLPCSAGIVMSTGLAGSLWWTDEAARKKTESPHAVPSLALHYSYTSHPPRYMNDVSWSSDNQFIACAIGDNTVQVLQARTGVVEGVYRQHKDYINCAQWANDSQRIASAGKDTTVHVWNASKKETLLIYRGHKKSVYYLAWSHDGTKIASGGAEGLVHVWDSFTGQHISTYTGHTGSVWSIRWAPDDQSVVSGGHDGIVHVWEPLSARPSSTFRDAGQTSTNINEVDWSPDGKRIISAHTNGKVYAWDAYAGTNLFTYSAHTDIVRTARCSPTGTYIASGGADKTLRIWEALNGKTIITTKNNMDDILEIVWSSDGTNIASSSKDFSLKVYAVHV